MRAGIALGILGICLVSGAGIVAPRPAVAGGASTVRVSVSTSGREGHGDSFAGELSASGRFVAFQSSAGDLVQGDSNRFSDIFVRDLVMGSTSRVSVSSRGSQANGDTFNANISHDGRIVSFDSHYATNLVPDDTGPLGDVFVRDRRTAKTTRVSVSSSGAEANGVSGWSELSADGRFVTFSSSAANLVAGDTNDASDIFVRDRRRERTTRVSVATSGGEANAASLSSSISGNGRLVAFSSDATNLAPGCGHRENTHLYVHDRATGRTTCETATHAGVPANDYSSSPALSPDGRYLAFDSAATNLVPGDTNLATDVFVRDRRTGRTERVSLNSQGRQTTRFSGSFNPKISRDGRFVAFDSHAGNLVSGDTNGELDVFVRDRATGTTIRASLGCTGGQTDALSSLSGMSANGRDLTFTSPAANLVTRDTNARTDVFLRRLR